MSEVDENDYEALAHKQGQMQDLENRLKAAIHYTVGRICQEFGQEKSITFNRQFIAALSEAACKQCESFAIDLELFAKHAKRSTVNPDDVKLLIRRNPNLLKYITEQHTAQTAEKVVRKKPAKKSKKKSSNEGGEPSSVTNDDSNM